MKPALRTLSLALLLAPATLVAQVPSDAVLRDFEPAGAYVVELGSEALDRADVYFSERAVAFLIVAPELESAVLIRPRSRTVEGVDPAKVDPQGDGTVDLFADALLTPLGTFEIDSATQAVRFELGSTPAKLEPKAPLTGSQTAENLLVHDPAYAYKAAGYDPAPPLLAALRKIDAEVRVRVYFGSWCPVCGRLVPRILRVAQELDDVAIHFEYYGLPQAMGDDPITEREDVRSVPTAVVFVDGTEAARLSGKQLGAPEQALVDVLGD